MQLRLLIGFVSLSLLLPMLLRVWHKGRRRASHDRSLPSLESPNKILALGPVLDAIIDATGVNGPLVIESWDCEHCHAECWCVHDFREVIVCQSCGQRHASAVKEANHE